MSSDARRRYLRRKTSSTSVRFVPDRVAITHATMVVFSQSTRSRSRSYEVAMKQVSSSSRADGWLRKDMVAEGGEDMHGCRVLLA